MTEELTPEINDKLSELISSIADEYLVGRPIILGSALFCAVEKVLLKKINEIEKTFK